jgi:hypothetical protein
MKLTKSKNYDINYLAKVVNIKSFEKHPDPEVNKIKIALVGGYNVVVGIDSEPGLYIYFPTLSQINPELLAYANLYRHKEKNKDDSKSGFFEDNGKVTAIKLRGVISEGFLMEWDTFNNWLIDSVNKSVEANEDEEFDTVEEGSKTFWVNKKYVKPLSQNQHVSTGRRGKQLKRFDRVIENQFRFHYDTIILRKTPYVIQPDDILSITEKIHGTSGISAYVLCHNKCNWTWKRKLSAWIDKHIFRFNVIDYDYDYIYASRSVIKNRYFNKNVTSGFYKCDVWAEADKVIKPHLDRGMTAYYEIVGYLPTGGYIQKNYDYGCVKPEENETYTVDKHFKVRIYRLTLTNIDGVVHEFSAREVQQWCNSHGLCAVNEWYYGYAKDLYPDIPQDENWSMNFMNRLADDKKFYMEKNSPSCNNKVPHEGLVLKTEKMHSEAWKLKCFAFLKGELADEDSNIEDNA